MNQKIIKDIEKKLDAEKTILEKELKVLTDIYLNSLSKDVRSKISEQYINVYTEIKKLNRRIVLLNKEV
jgi:hypothetical protein